MRGIKYFIALILLVSVCTESLSQEIKVTGSFLTDSVRIGEPVGFALSARYPQHLTILFPDSTFSFAPFEFTSKKIFTTQTQNGISYDSTIYYLQTFEIDPTQRLLLPVFVTTARDCTTLFTKPDSVFLIQLVKSAPDSVAAQNLPLKINTLYEKVFSQFNYVLLLIIGLSLAVAAIIIWIFFGKRIIRYFKARKLLKNHQAFISRFESEISSLSTSFSKEVSEQAVSLWKKYMEQLEQKPYTKLTTRETVSMLGDAAMGEHLQKLDRAIYGHQTMVIEPLQNLQQIAETHFRKKINDIKHG